MKKGITMLALIITILIMLIISSTVVISGSGVLNSSKAIKFGTEISYVQSLVDSYKEYNNGNYPITDISLNINISKVNVEDRTQFNGEDISDNLLSLYKFDKSLFEGIDLLFGNEKDSLDVYAVSIKTGKVYYLKGVKISVKTYFTLTDDLKEKIGYTNIDENILNKDGIIFESSNKNWTSDIINSSVRVPTDYKDTLVEVNGSSTTTIEKNASKDGYDVYSISSISGNYSVKVSYNKNGKNLFQIFNVENFDNVKPVITVDNTKNFISSDSKEITLSINAIDELSGIKLLKYETEKIDEDNIPSYFRNNGIDISNNTITLNKYVSYITIYAQDYAGNYTYLYKEIKTTLDENDYVSNGLIAKYDAIKNTGISHESTNLWKDLTGNGFDITLYGINNTTTSGWKEDGLILDGIDDYGVINNLNISNLKDLTICVTYTILNADSDKIYSIVSTESSNDGCMSFGYSIKNGKNLYNMSFSNINNIANGEKYFEANKLQNICAIYAGTNTSIENSIYKNSQKIVTYKKISSNAWVSSNLLIGKSFEGNISGYNMANVKINSILIYDRALNSNEIRQNYLVDKARYNI